MNEDDVKAILELDSEARQRVFGKMSKADLDEFESIADKAPAFRPQEPTLQELMSENEFGAEKLTRVPIIGAGQKSQAQQAQEIAGFKSGPEAAVKAAMVPLAGAGTVVTAPVAGGARLIQSKGDVGAAAKAFTESAMGSLGLTPHLEQAGIQVPEGETAIEIVLKKAASGEDLTGWDKTGYYFEHLAPILPLGSIASGARAAVAAGAEGATVGESLAAMAKAPATTGILNTQLTKPIVTRTNIANFVNPMGGMTAQLEAKAAQRLQQAQDLAVSRTIRLSSEKAQKLYAAQQADLITLEADLAEKAAEQNRLAAMFGTVPDRINTAAPQEAALLAQQAHLAEAKQTLAQTLQKIRQEDPDLVTFSNQTLADIRQNVAQPASGKAKGDIFKTVVERKREQVAAQMGKPANPFFRQASPEDVAFSIQMIAKNPGYVYTQNLNRTDAATQPSVPPVIPPSNGEAALTSYRQGPTLWNRTASNLKKWGLYVESNLKNTPSGTQLYREVEDYNAKLAFAKATTDQLSRRWTQLLTTADDTQAATHLAHGLEVPKGLTYNTENVTEAVRLWRNADDALLRAAQAVGLDIKAIPNHFRLKYRPDLQAALANKDPVIMKAIIRNLVKDGLDEKSATKLITFQIANAKDQQELFEAFKSAGIAVNSKEDAVRMLANSDPAQRWALIQIARKKITGKSVGEVVQEISENGMSYRNRTNHSLETQRRLNIPELADMNDFVHNASDALDRGWERVLQVKKFGLVDEAGMVDPLAQKLVDAYASESAKMGFTEGADLGKRYLDLSLRRNPETEYLRIFRTGAAMVQLPFAFLGQSAGLVTNATFVRPAAMMEGAFRTLRSRFGSGLNKVGSKVIEGFATDIGSADREFVLSTAVMSDRMMPGIYTEAASNVSNALSGRSFLQAAEQTMQKVSEKTNYLVYVTDRLGKEIAVNSGAAWGRQIFKRLQREGLGGKNQWAIEMLRDAGVNVERALQKGALAESDLALIGRMVANRTASQGAIKDLPLAFQNELGKTILQYKGSVTNAARTYKQVLIDQFKTGRLDDATISLMTAVVGSQAVGESINQIRDWLYGNKEQKSAAMHVIDNFAAVGLAGTFDQQAKNAALALLGKATRPDSDLRVPALSAIENVGSAALRTPSALFGDQEARERFLEAAGRVSPLLKVAFKRVGLLPEK